MKYLFLLLFLLTLPSSTYGEAGEKQIGQVNQKNLVKDGPLNVDQEVQSQADLIFGQQEQISSLQLSIKDLESTILNINDQATQSQKDIILLEEEFYLTVDELQSNVSHIYNLINSLAGSINESESEILSDISYLQSSLKNITDEIENVKSTLTQYDNRATSSIALLKEDLNDRIHDQGEQLFALREAIEENRTDFLDRLAKVDQELAESYQRQGVLGTEIDRKVKKLCYWILIVGLLAISGIFLFIIIRHKTLNSNENLKTDLSNIHQQMNEDNLRLDTKLADLLQKQIQLKESISSAPEHEPHAPVHDEPDHSLAIRAGEEILRMRNRLNTLPGDTKGLKPMLKSLERLENELRKSGYELVDMLGQQFDSTLNAQARFIPNEDLADGEQIITKVIKPQINYNDKVIQISEIEVSTGGE